MKLLVLLGTCALATAGGGGPWDHIGPWNIFDAIDEAGNPMGEAGTLACAASPPAHPDIIYAGGQNNGVSSGVIKTVENLALFPRANLAGPHTMGRRIFVIASTISPVNGVDV